MSAVTETHDSVKVGSDLALDPQAASAIARLAPSGSETHDEAVRTLTPGNSASGVIDFAGDTDRIRMNLEPGTYLVSLRGSGDDPLLDPYLTSRNSGIADDDDGGTGINSLVTFTVTEAGAIACVYCILISVLVYRQLGLRELGRAMVTAARGTAAVMLIVGASGLMGWLIADLQINKQAADLIFRLTDSPWIFLTVINIFFLIVGMFMDPLAALIVFVPILLPAAIALGIDPIHFGVVIVINLMIGLCTPPVGYLIYLMANVANESPQNVIRESLPFVGVLLLTLLATTFVPALTLALPRLILGG